MTRFSGAASFLALLSLASAAAFNHPRADAAECQFKEPGGPLLVTTDCIDPQYNSPIITNETDETHPVPHRRIQGHFNGTAIDFSIYLPPHGVWQGRFFQQVYPLQNSSALDQAIGFGYDSGGYTVQNKGLQGYRAEAATAKLSRRIARDYYKDPSRSIYGYIYGGSGGSYQTIGAMENTFGVWDGSLTYVQATKYSNPNNWPIRAVSGLFLVDKKELIRDAVAPGGSGDPFSILNKAQRAVFEETTALGVPLRAWEDYEGVGQNRSLLYGSLIDQVANLVNGLDPTYVDDFWKSPGYLGTEKSELGDFFRVAVVEFNTTVKDVTLSNTSIPTEFIVDKIPTNISVLGLDFAVVYKNGSTGAFKGRLDAKSKTIYINPGASAAVLTTVKSGAKMHVNNRLYLAVHTLYRHQLPPMGANFYGYDFLRNARGEPRYPQRKAELAEMISKSTSGGGNQTGKLTGKVIVLDNLLDYDAFPWHADWYKTKVKNAMGDKFNDYYRLYYVDNSDHFSDSELPASTLWRLIPYRGLMEQHLRDLSRWVEKGTAPPKPTRYTVTKGQVHIPATATERQGIQPIVDLTANGAANRTKARVGEAVSFKLHAEVPPNAGKIVKVEWDFDGVGEFAEKGSIAIEPAVDVKVYHTFSKPGTYIVGVRVTNQRQGIKDTPYALVQNLGRVRVVVV